MDPHPTRNPLFYFLVHIEEFREERDIVGREREENEWRKNIFNVINLKCTEEYI